LSTFYRHFSQEPCQPGSQLEHSPNLHQTVAPLPPVVILQESRISSGPIFGGQATYRLRPKVLPDDRDDIEIEIVLKLKAEAGKKEQVTMGFLYAVAKNVVRTYWRKKYRERRRFSRFYEGDNGEMIAEPLFCLPTFSSSIILAWRFQY